MSFSEFKLPDYREQAPAVAARFERIRTRPVILSIRDLKKCFGSNGDTHVVFDHVSLDIHRREFICVIGKSGCEIRVGELQLSSWLAIEQQTRASLPVRG